MISLQLRKITKSFPGVKALRGIDLEVSPGEIHALCGENGAGKSTLMNILSGNLQPDSGTLSINGIDTRFTSPAEAFAAGIGIVHQHLSLVDGLSVEENIFANQQPVNTWGIIRFSALRKKSQALLESLNLTDISPSAKVSSLTPAQRQLVEIAKSLSRSPSLLILDEPTAALTDKETTILFAILRDLRKRNTAVIYISHRLDEIFKLADRITVIKDGEGQGTFDAKTLTRKSLILKMVGRALPERPRAVLQTGPVVLDVVGLSGSRFSDITFSLHAGEILGMAGLAGAGRTEIARALFGADPHRGVVTLQGTHLRARHPADAVAASMAYVPEDRKNMGLFPAMSLRDNIIAAALPLASPAGLYREQIASDLAQSSRNQLRIVCRDIDQPVSLLSGGNQQKVILARWLITRPQVLIVDEPTHGIDVGAKYEIYQLLEQLAAKGTALLVISSELPELLGICSRILVIREGKIAGTLTGDRLTEQNIMSLAAV